VKICQAKISFSINLKTTIIGDMRPLNNTYKASRPVKKKSAQYKQKWWNHVSRMEDITYPKQFLNYWPTRKWRLGQPLKRLQSRYNHEVETGHLLALWSEEDGKRR